MRYYMGSKMDPLYALYEKNGAVYPVFAEKYGTESVLFSKEWTEITDAETLAALDKYMYPYGEGKARIYMAGPLFNEGDRYTNQRNSDALRELGYTTFLPQEIVITDESTPLVKAACLYMDLKAIYQCDVLLANCNGIEVDSGTAAEIGLGYGIGKKMVAYKSDVRNYFNDVHRLNNFVAGLVGNKVCRTMEEVVAAIEELLA